MATLMLLLTIPFSALKVEAAEPIPHVRINSQFFSDNTAGYRVYPDFDGNFILTLSVDYADNIDEDIVVYYRTEDDTAVAEWGDYEPVGVYEDAKVTLTKANGYKAVIKISSKLLDYALQINHKSFQSATYGSRRFIFKILKIEGANAEAYAFSRKFYCYLRANTYFNSDFYGQLTTKTHLKPAMYWNLEEYIAKKGTATKEFDLSTKIPAEWKNLVDKGIFNLGVSVNGDAYEKYWQSDGDTTLTMYYRIGEKAYPAFSLCIEGEFDDCTYYGIEAAYYYLYDVDFLRYLDSDCDVDDFWKDNFRGFTLYGNGGEKIYEIYINKQRSNRDAVGEELLRLEKDPYMTILDSGRGLNHQHGYYLEDLHFLKMPSDYLKAD